MIPDEVKDELAALIWATETEKLGTFAVGPTSKAADKIAAAILAAGWRPPTPPAHAIKAERPTGGILMIPDEVVEAAAEALVSSALGDRAGIKWEEFFEAARLALNASAPQLMAQAFDEGQKSGLRHADRLIAAAKIGRLDLPGPLRPNPYRKDAK